MNCSPVLLTDLYELTMSFGYWKWGVAEREAVFHHFFREQPFGNGFAVAAGLGTLIEFFDNFRFSPSDLQYLASLKTVNGGPLFGPEFLEYLKKLEFNCDVDAIPEGTFVFPHEPLVRVTGPLLQAQILETIVLNLINYQTLVATKAARIRLVCGSDDLMEFGLRRAQGKDGGLSASRAAYVGGVDGVSNVEAGKQFGIPVRGTMAHSWIMSFEDEPAAFAAWAEVMPDNVVLLVDTYDTPKGVRNAVRIGLELKSRGKRLIAIRLDSGDLLSLSRDARAVLDAAGLQSTKIIASNELDEHRIRALKQQGAPITGWGVGTRLVTGHEQSSLGGVYKLGVIRDDSGRWSHRMKYAGALEKTSEPGILQVRRFRNREGIAVGDVVYDSITGCDGARQARDAQDVSHHFSDEKGEDLLVPIFRKGKRVYEVPPLARSRELMLQQLDQFSPDLLRLDSPASYFIGTEQHLASRKEELMKEAHARSRGCGHSE